MTLFEEALYSGTSIPNILTIYSDNLRSRGSNRDILHSNKMLEYKSVINTKSHAKLRNIFDNFYKVIVREMPHLRFRIAGRRKSLISVEQKIERNIKLNKSLDLIRDILGVRIILLNGSLEDCYAVLEKLIECCFLDGFTICEEDCESTQEQYLSSFSPILGHFSYGIKDYIHFPKDNGYQSLHAVFRNSSGFCFEVQVRTFEMHCNAVNGSASHSAYKDSKYAKIEFDREKIHVPGYSVLSDGAIMDLIGLERSLEVLQRNKSF